MDHLHIESFLVNNLVRIDDLIVRDWDEERTKIRREVSEFSLLSSLLDNNWHGWLNNAKIDHGGDVIKGCLGTFFSADIIYSQAQIGCAAGDNDENLPRNFFSIDTSTWEVKYDFIDFESREVFRDFPLLALYCVVNRKRLEFACDSALDLIGLRGKPPYFLDPAKTKWQYKSKPLRCAPSVTDFQFYDKWGYHAGVVQLHQSGLDKYFLPLFQWKHAITGASRDVPLLPSPSPFYRPALANRSEGELPEVVLLTDSLELAKANFLAWKESGQGSEQQVEMASWYGGIEGLDHLDFSVFEGRQVVYLMMEHSGLSPAEVWNTASKVVSRINGADNSKISFASYLAGSIHDKTPSTSVQNIPRLYTYEDFMEIVHTATVSPTRHPREYKPNPMQRINHHRNFLFEPFLEEGSATLIFGDRGCGKTWFTVSRAFAMTHGVTLAEQWKSKGRSWVIYIHEEPGLFSFGNKLETALRMMTPSKRIRDHTSQPFAQAAQQGLSSFPCTSLQDGFMGKDLPPLGLSEKEELNNLCNSRFRWMTTCPHQLDITQPVTQNYIMEAVLEVETSKTDEMPSTLILDGLSSIEKLRRGDASLNGMRDFLNKLKGLNTSIILVPPGISGGRKRVANIERLGIDNVVEIKHQQAHTPDDLNLSVHVYKAAKRHPELKTRSYMRFNPDAERPQWQIVRDSRPRTEIETEVGKFTRQGMTEKETACMVGISLSLVKKMKRELGLSKRRQYL